LVIVALSSQFLDIPCPYRAVSRLEKTVSVTLRQHYQVFFSEPKQPTFFSSASIAPTINVRVVSILNQGSDPRDSLASFQVRGSIVLVFSRRDAMPEAEALPFGFGNTTYGDTLATE
jgi:hypothetical protein